MKPLRTVLGVVGVAILAVGTLLAVYSAHADNGDRSTSRSTIKIGAIVPFEGQTASLGKSFLEAVRVSIDNLDDTKYNYELVVEDGGTTPEESERAARRLIEEDGADAIVGGISATGRWVAPLATKVKVPQICVCSIPTIGDGEYNFTNIPLAADEAEAWVAEAKSRGLRTIAILAQSYPSIDGHVAAVKEAAAKAGMQVVYEYRFPAGTTEFLKPMMAAGEKSPDVYFVSAYEPSLTAVGKQIKVAEKVHGTKLNVASIVAISVSEDIRTFDGAWYTDSDINEALIAQFEKAYPSSEFITHMMPYAYDSIRMLVKGFESDEGVVEYLRNLTSYDGSVGPITREPGSGNFRSKPVVWLVKDGRPEVEATGRTRPGHAASRPAASSDPDAPEPINPHGSTTTP